MNHNLQGRSFSILPTVVKNLLIINGLFFLATWVLKNTYHYDLVETLGLYYFESEKFRVWQLVTHLFMHGGTGHLFSNMFSLWMFGYVLENVWGPKRFLTYYLITGFGAAVLHTFVNYLEISSLQDAANGFLNTPSPAAFYSFIRAEVPSHFTPTFIGLADAWEATPNVYQYQQNAISLVNQLVQSKINIPTVGASGAVFGVLLAYGMLFPNTIIYLYFAIPVKVKYFVMVYGAIELFQGFRGDPTDNVAHFAHLGGMLFGYLLIKHWQKDRNSFY